HDGVVTLAEARVPGARDLILLPVTHSAMPLSRRVAAEVAGFLRDGRFSETARRP
ncbi:MAG: acetyltransferase, partial [Proteobacteria bacterium]|nr:acetyltransferase [Burkholderiales bacterium]